MVKKVETLLQQDRYNTDEANRLSRDAVYKARHALYLNQQIV